MRAPPPTLGSKGNIRMTRRFVAAFARAATLAIVTTIGASVLGWGAASPAGAAPPAVVASIKPVHSLVAAVGEGVGAPTLLVEGGGSPHAYALRPSEARAVQNADVVFWIGPEMETFLAKALGSLAGDAHVVALSTAPGITLLPYREDEDWSASPGRGDGADDKDGYGHEDGHGDGHGHVHGAMNMHIWLDPENARAMAVAIADTLATADPANAGRYRSNAAQLDERLVRFTADIDGTLAAVKGRPYIVFHDAYAYFEHRFGMTPVGAITISPDRQPSAQGLAAIRATIERTGAVCVFSEPQFEPALVRTVIEGTGARLGVLDPLGGAVPPGPDAYPTLMRALARSLADCLARNGH
jgi:zinc transport system substrate-binding protein